MKRIIKIVTLLVFCSLFIRASFAQQAVTTVCPYKDFIIVKKAFFEDKSAHDKFISASMLVQAYKKIQMISTKIL